MKRKLDKAKEKQTKLEDGLEMNFQEKSDIRGDEINIIFLFCLYLLQGIPLGLCKAIPMLLQKKHVSYKQQAEFSFVTWPYSLKLLWAPIVDAIFLPQFGRRKTWLIPVQILLGIFMILLSFVIDDLLGENGGSVNIALLTIAFFTLNTLAATQDIVVDGWALTMLKRCNVGYASTCNTVGQTAGFFLGYVLFLAVESADFSNNYLRSEHSEHGMVTLPEFLYFWGITFIVITLIVAVVKSEKPEKIAKTQNWRVNIKEAYHTLLETTKLPNIRLLVVLLLTIKIGFSACDVVTSLKLVDAGIPKENIALMVVPMIPLNLILPLIISKYTTGPRPIDVCLKAMPYRLAFGLVAMGLVWLTPYIVQSGHVPPYFFIGLVILYLMHQVTTNTMFVALMSFFAKISDPSSGGTYMTLLNTICNLGGIWPETAALWLVDPLTFRKCSTDPSNDCSTDQEKEMCLKTDNGVCDIQIDGFYIESLLCVIVGFLWLRWGRRKILSLQSKPLSTWKVKSNR